tara:strand:- start:49 stop:216 length:168 start_codon:yes stop_codon:yes gene_type:complete
MSEVTITITDIGGVGSEEVEFTSHIEEDDEVNSMAVRVAGFLAGHILELTGTKEH